VLLVDDDSDFLQLLRAALKREAYDLLTATSARSALEILHKEVVDVVVADENMPGMSGTDLLAIVAGEFPACGRIILTGQVAFGKPEPLDSVLAGVRAEFLHRAVR
jgi:serine/threonine-protein kinase